MTQKQKEPEAPVQVTMAERLQELVDRLDDVDLRDTRENVQRHDDAMRDLRALLAEAEGKVVLIPLDMCRELSILGKGKTVGLKVLGILTDKGVVVENVSLLR